MFGLRNKKNGGLITNLVMKINTWPRTSFLAIGMGGIFTDFPDSMKLVLEALYNVNNTLFDTLGFRAP